MHQGKLLWGHSKKAAIYKPGREPSATECASSQDLVIFGEEEILRVAFKQHISDQESLS